MSADGQTVRIKVYRYNPDVDDEPYFDTFHVPWHEKMRLLDALRWIQQNRDASLAVRWNCGEGVCGSDGMRVNGKPVLACKTEITQEWLERENTVEPMKTLPVVKDLVVDHDEVYDKEKKITPFFRGTSQEDFRDMSEEETRHAQEMRKCISCMLCYDVCHAIRNDLDFVGPRNMVKAASFSYHPGDEENRVPDRVEGGMENCNVTRCCSEICPQDINITENAIIPFKEQAVSQEQVDPVETIAEKTRALRATLRERVKGRRDNQ